MGEVPRLAIGCRFVDGAVLLALFQTEMGVEGEGPLPDFVDIVVCLADRAAARLKSRDAVTYGTKTLPFDVNAYTEVGPVWPKKICTKANGPRNLSLFSNFVKKPHFFIVKTK